MTSIRTAALCTGAALCLVVVAACAPGAPGTPTASPSASASPSSMPAAITIDSPAEGATTTTPVELNGTANTFEAALTVDAVDADGNVLCVRNIMATSGMGTPGTWETTLAFPPPGSALPVTVRAYEFSAKDGSIVNLVERAVTVSTERPAIFITSPSCGAAVSAGSPLTVSGRALVFEAQFTIELRDGAGVAVLTQQAMAASGTEESPFTASLAIPASLPGGAYDLVAYDNSAKDGSVVHEFAVQLIIEP